METYNPWGSVKDRVGAHLLQYAADSGRLEDGSVQQLVDATGHSVVVYLR